MNLKVVRPHARVLVALVFGVLVIGGSFYLRGTKPTEGASGIAVAPAAPREPQDVIDTDSDGLPDWKEDLYGTDPLVAGEAPSAATAISSTSEDIITFDEIPDSFTKRFSAEFMGSYLTGREQAGDISMTPEEEQDFAKNLMQSAALQLQDVPYTRANIQVSSASDISSVEAYGNALGSVMLRYPLPKDSNELIIASKAVQENRPDDLKKLTPIIETYARTIADMKALSVPLPVVNEHLALLNALRTIHNDIVAMQKIYDDPLPALIRIQTYHQRDLQTVADAVYAMRTALQSIGAVFTEQDPAWIFFRL